MTAPWSPQAPLHTRQSVRHEWRVSARTRAGDVIELDLEDGQVTWDETWSPHVEASLTCRVPEDQAVLDALDPRSGCRLIIDAGYIPQLGGQDVHQLADLRLHSRDVNRPTNRLQLVAVSNEIRAHDASALTAQQPPSNGVGEALAWLIRQAMDPDGAVIDNQVGDDYYPGVLPEEPMQPGDHYWPLIADIAGSVNLWVRDPGDGRWIIGPAVTEAGSATETLTVGPGGTLTRSSTRLDTEEWANTVLIRHEWRTAGGDDRSRIGIGQVLSGPRSVTEAGMKAVVVDRDNPTTGRAVTLEARSLASRLVSRGRSMSLEGISAYWLRPGQTVTVQLPTGPQERHLIATVAFRYPAGDMTLTTRVPEDVVITTGE